MRYETILFVALLLTGAFLVIGWFDVIHLVAALIWGIPLAAVIRWWRKRNRQPLSVKHLKHRVPEPLGHLLIRGFLAAMGLVAYFSLTFALIPVDEVVGYLRGCPDLGKRIDVATSVGAWEAAVSLIDSVLQEPLTTSCRKTLVKQRVALVLEWVGNLGESQARLKLREAIAQAEGLGLADQIGLLRDRLMILSCPALPPGARGDIRQIDTYRYPEVEAYVSIEDDEGHVMDFVTRKCFDVYVNGQLLAVEQLATPRRQPYPVSVALCIDASGSMDTSFEDVRWAATTFLKSLSSNDYTELIVFNDIATRLVGWTKDKNHIVSEVRGIVPKGNTALYDAINMAIEDSKMQNGCKAIVVVTDGSDTRSRHDFDETLAAATSAGVPIYAIGIASQDLDRATLRRVGGETDGGYIEAENAADLDHIYAEIAQRVRGLYRLAFVAGSASGAEDTLSIAIGADDQIYLQKTYRPPIPGL